MVRFQEVEAPRPEPEAVAGEYRELEAAFDAAGSAEERRAAIRRWDDLRRRLDTWGSLVHLRFEQDTRDPQAKADKEYCDEINPKLTELAVAFKKKLLASAHRPELEASLGAQAFALWESEATTYEPAIEQEMVREAKLTTEYLGLIASARFEYRGETLNLSGLAKFSEHADRSVRHETSKLRWDWFAEHGATFDRVFDELVGVRHAMAGKLGFANFIELGYKRMCRVDYDQADVERFRAEVREHVVPLAVELKRRQAERLGLDKTMVWDDAVHDLQGNPAPQGDHDWMVARAQEMFDAMGGGLGSFFTLMREGGFMDLKTREGKNAGGFCTAFPSYGVPYIFANFNGTKHDVEVFTHEIGHAFQCYSSRAQEPFDYLWPTAESCEIHSMSLEFLTWPHMERFFGDDAERFRRVHLEQGLLFLPYGVAADHYQHLVYERPDATPEERHGFWREMERLYLPWVDWGDLAHGAKGGRWQMQMHLYHTPFYYIDYVLAQICAMQFWVRAEADRAEAMDAYVALCARGGEAPFQALARGAGLTSPFEDGCLVEVVSQARETLGVA